MASDDPGDETLMLRYARGDAQAFEVLYRRHRARLWRFLIRQLQDETSTADVFQETWSRVISHRLRYEPRARFGTWLYRIAHHCCVDHWRQTGRRRQREIEDPHALLEDIDDEATPGPAQVAEDAEAAERLRAALSDLPDAQREAFLLFAEAGLDLPAIAEVTGVGAETAKSRLRYATAKLKRALAPAPDEES
jgi:RNA polymerase sigma-70 factor (ECF subfamily)